MILLQPCWWFYCRFYTYTVKLLYTVVYAWVNTHSNGKSWRLCAFLLWVHALPNTVRAAHLCIYLWVIYFPCCQKFPKVDRRQRVEIKNIGWYWVIRIEIAFLTINTSGLLPRWKCQCQQHKSKCRLGAIFFVLFCLDSSAHFIPALSWGTSWSSDFTQILQYVSLWRVHFRLFTYCVQANEA